MRRCIVHFGMPKTGSSSIQATVFGHPGDQRLRYLHGGSANGSGMLATAFMANPSRFHVNRKLGLSGDEVEARRTELLAGLDLQLQQPANLYLLSGESLSNFRIADLRNLVRWLDRRFDSVRAVGYIRPPRGFMESAFQQNVKTADADLDFAQLYPHYQQRFEPMEKAFGAERVQYWKFDPAAFPNGDVVSDFAQRIGVDLTGIPIQRVNEGLSRDAVSLLYCFRQFGPGFGSGPGALVVNGLLHRAVAGLGGEKLRFSDRVIAPILRAQHADLDWISERLGAKLDETPQDDDRCISTAQELLQPSAQASQWLADQVGQPWRPGLGPEQIADWMGRLRDQLAEHRESQRAARRAARAGGQEPRRQRPAAPPAPLPPASPPVPRAIAADTVSRQPVRQLSERELARQLQARLPDGELSPAQVQAAAASLLEILREELAQTQGGPLRLQRVGTLRAHGGRGGSSSD